MKKALVIIPTYNERETLPLAIDSVLKYEGFDILVVDDGSPDGTAQLVREIMGKDSRLALIERRGKLGLGTAYVEGFKWGLKRGYDYFFEMDADMSHDPDALPSFILDVEKGYGLVVGSRYLNGTISVVGWDFKRLMLSKFGNYYASWVLGLRLTDMTSGFRCYTRGPLEAIDLDGIHSNGYSFQIEMAYRISVAGFKVGEIPIIFYERATGVSKMSKKIFREAVVLPWMLRLARTLGGLKGAKSDLKYHARTVIGFLSLIIGLAGSLRLGWWLGTEGDIIEVIHRAKIALPGWAWTMMKVGLSALSGAAFIVFFLALATAIFAAGRRK